jgi:hypothetical protein
MVIQLVQDYASLQTFSLKIGSVLEVQSAKTLGNSAPIKDYSHPSNAIVFGQEIDRFLAPFKLIDN